MTLKRIFSDGEHTITPRIFDVDNGETQKVTWPWMLPSMSDKIWPAADFWSLAAINDAIDDLYFGRSGNKFISPFVYDNAGGFDEHGLIRNPHKLSQRLYIRYVQKWTHLLELYVKEYDPLHSYSLTEATQRAGTDTDTGTVGVSGSGSNSVTRPQKSNTSQKTNTPNITETLTGTDRDVTEEDSKTTTTPETVKTTVNNGNSQQQNSRYGFNSANAAPVTSGSDTVNGTATESMSGKETVEADYDGTVTRTLSESRARTGSEQESIQSTETYSGPETASSTKAETETRNLSRSTTESVNSTKAGNMFKSPATLLDDDRSFWFLDYLELVFDDVDALLTLDIYSESEIQTYVW